MHLVLTFVDHLQLRDDVQTDVRVLVLEHLKEHGEEMGNSPIYGVSIM